VLAIVLAVAGAGLITPPVGMNLIVITGLLWGCCYF